jgi:hypothetical protein
MSNIEIFNKNSKFMKNFFTFFEFNGMVFSIFIKNKIMHHEEVVQYFFN